MAIINSAADFVELCRLLVIRGRDRSPADERGFSDMGVPVTHNLLGYQWFVDGTPEARCFCHGSKITLRYDGLLICDVRSSRGVVGVIRGNRFSVVLNKAYHRASLDKITGVDPYHLNNAR